MSLRRVGYDVGVMLGALRVPYNTTSVIKHITSQFIVEQFGLVISVINNGDYSFINDKVTQIFKGYRTVYVTPSDDINEKRYEVLWALMQSGYMRWLRSIYPAQYPNILEADNLANRIIDQRLERWGDMPKNRFHVEYNLQAREMGMRRTLTQDPSFFDYMP